MNWIFSLFTNLGRLPLYLAIGAFAIGLITAVYYGWKNQVEQRALLEFNQKQLEQIIRDQQLFSQKMRDIESSQREIVEDLEKQNAEIDSKLKSIDGYLLSPEAKKVDRPASIILKNTVNQLRGSSK